MAKVDSDFLFYLQDSVDYIAKYTFAIYIMMHWEDPYYLKTVQTLISWLDRKMDPIYARPEDTTGWDVDQLCTWLSMYSVDLTKQDIPSVYQEIYSAAMEQTRPDGTLKRRSPFKINPKPSAEQLAVRNIFLAARNCFKNQFRYKAITAPTTGYRSRGYWYNDSMGSGLFYYTYFMQQTLNIMFGPLIHDKYPFAGQQTPDWCSSCNKAEEWTYTPMAADDFIFCHHSVSLPTGTFSNSLTLKAAGDPDSPTPGDPEVLSVTIGIQAVNAEQEPTGPLATHTLAPIGPDWVSPAFDFQAGADTAGFQLSITCNNGDGDYLLYFRNAEQDNFAGEPQLHIHGADGDSFGWTVGSGDFAFKAFVSV